jgi:hypothetical protein
MSIVLSILQKNIADLTTDDIVNFFSEEREETASLEFKSGELEKEELNREVCAFLNTEGGVIIYGAPREKEVNKKRVCVGDPVPCSKVKGEHSLVSSIAANISPIPSNMKVKCLDYKDGHIFILEVPQSMHPPHQVSSKGTYYIRLDKEARPAPHGIVEAFFNKRQKPKLALSFEIGYSGQNWISLKFQISNLTEYTAESTGYSFQVYGIEQISAAEQINSDSALDSKNKIFTIRSAVHTPILVKDLNLHISAEVRPSMLNQIVVKALIWCKDGKLSSYYFTFNALNAKQPVQIYSSEEPEQEIDMYALLSEFHAYINMKNGN